MTTAAPGPVLRELTVEVAPERVARVLDRAYKDLAKRVRIPGFRPGKAPRSVLEKRYGAAIGEDVERALVAETLPEAIAEAEIEPVAEPSIDATPPEPGAAFRYVARIEVKPEVELPQLDGLEARRPAADVPEADVERELESLRERRAPLVDLPDGATAAEGHFLTIDYVGRIDGEAFEGGSAEGASIELGSGRFIPGFEEGLLGARAGEERTLEVDFPDDYGNEDVAGKHASFEVEVKAVRHREPQALDDAFAKEVGDFENVDALRERIRSDLEQQRERGARAELRRTLLDWILERTEFEVPDGLVERRLHQRLAAAHEQLQHAMPEDQLHERLRAWRDEWRPAAEREVREELVLEAVARRESLEPSDEDVEARIEELAKERGMAAHRLRKGFEERGVLPALRAELREQRAVDFLAAQAKVEEVPGT